MNDLILKLFCALKADRRGVTAMEYAVMAGVVITVVLVAFQGLFGALSTELGTIGTKLGALPG